MKLILNTKYLVILFFGVLCMSVFVAIAGSSKGAEIVVIEQKIKALEQENRELQGQVVSQNSLKQAAQKAPEKGLTKNVSLVYWNQDVSVAVLP